MMRLSTISDHYTKGINDQMNTDPPKKSSGIPLGEWSGSDATNALHETIREFIDASNQQAQKMVTLTRVIVVLTVVMAIGLGIQIYLQAR